MSRAVNRVTLVGNLGADPEVRATPNGGRVATLSLATSKTWTNDKGEKQEKTAWHRVICWNAAKGAPLADLSDKVLNAFVKWADTDDRREKYDAHLSEARGVIARRATESEEVVDAEEVVA